MMYNVRRTEIKHHGILGMHWGKQNGPPYPLGSEDHSEEEKREAKKSGIAVGKDSGTSRRSKAIKIGVAVAGTALATYGAYKLVSSGKMNSVIAAGANAVHTIDVNKVEVDRALVGDAIPKAKSFDEIKNLVNPLKGERNHCTNCSVATFLSMNGRPASALGTNGQQRILGGTIEDIFKIPDGPDRRKYILDGSAVKFGRSKQDASEMLVKRFGENAQGVVSIEWKTGSPYRGGHAFNWKIKDGVVSFFDGQNGLVDAEVTNYWRHIDPQGGLTLARLDGLEVNEEALKRYVKLL